ncbi:MAG: hypothetical protein ABIN96_00040 [Rubrivivax sp.]
MSAAPRRGCSRLSPGDPRHHRRRAAGFVLPVTIVTLAIVAVGVAVMSHRSDQLRALVLASRQEQQATVQVHNTVAEALVLMGTRYRRGSRLGEIEIDGRWYRSAAGTFVRWQDAAGLMSLRRATEPDLQALLAVLGLPPEQILGLVDSLLDYADADSLRRLNGAEAADYAEAKLPPPRNAPLVSPMELRRIARWRDLDEATLQRVIANTSITNVGTVNRNTVSAPVLAALGGTDLITARTLLALRPAGAPVAIESLPNLAGGSFLAAGRFMTLPSPSTLVTVCPASVAWCQALSLTATFDLGEGPWHVEYSVRMMRTEPLPRADEVQMLPTAAPAAAPEAIRSPFGVIQ